jgi:4-hydroxy-3-polyprenylbenzoate decarboxylase
MSTNNRIIVGISGASGAAYAQRIIRVLVASGHEVHLVVSPLGQRLLHDELGMEKIDLPTLAGIPDQPNTLAHSTSTGSIKLHHYRDVGASIASGSFKHNGMVIVPCSSNSLSAVANGSADNLLHRAAAVALKERRRLILVHREMPLSPVDIRNMLLATRAGAIVCPANPGFYLLPKSIDDLIDFVAARILDLLCVEHNLSQRWGESDFDRNLPSRES